MSEVGGFDDSGRKRRGELRYLPKSDGFVVAPFPVRGRERSEEKKGKRMSKIESEVAHQFHEKGEKGSVWGSVVTGCGKKA